MNISELIQKLEPGALVEMFELDLSPITKTNTVDDHLYFHSGTNELNVSVVWQGKTYSPFPIDASGFDKSTRGTLPRPRIRAANVTGVLTPLNDAYDDMVGALITRRQTFARYLDAVNFAAGNLNADPNQHLPDEVYAIERKVTGNSVMVEWELASAMDLEGVQLPARSIIANYCPWRYRTYRGAAFDYTDVAECTYTGSGYFTVGGLTTADPTLDVCAKTMQACKLRFPTGTVMPFGGFPAARAYKL